jgi:hypothetical protein
MDRVYRGGQPTVVCCMHYLNHRCQQVQSGEYLIRDLCSDVRFWIRSCNSDVPIAQLEAGSDN